MSQARKLKEKKISNLALVEGLLKKQKIRYYTHSHLRTQTLLEACKQCDLNFDYFIRAVLLEDEQGYIMAIVPANRLLDFSALCEVSNRDFTPVPFDKLQVDFKKFDIGSYPPLPQIFGFDAIVDATIFEFPRVYFEPGSHELILELNQEEFLSLYKNFPQGYFTAQLSTLSESVSPYFEDFGKLIYKFTPTKLEKKLVERFEIPSLPKEASELLELIRVPRKQEAELAEWIKSKPNLEKKFQEWANLPFFQAKQKVQTNDEAIDLVGYELSLNFLFALSLIQSMRFPLDGPLGLRMHWELSLCTATLVDKLAQVMPFDIRPPRGIAHLAGLLHNFGHFILNEVFPAQFFILNRFFLVNPHIPLSQIETHVLGIHHEQMGAWTMRAWNMPKAIVAGIKWHHQGEFIDEYRIYPNLILVALRLLASISLGDTQQTQIPDSILQTLGLSYATAFSVFDEFLEQKQDLETLGDSMLSYLNNKN